MSVQNELDQAHERILDALAALIIPAEGQRPSGADVGFAGYVRQQGSLGWLLPGLDSLAQAASEQGVAPFHELDRAQQQTIVDGLKRKQFRFYGELANQLMLCYYQHEHVMPAIGMEARAPFPLGYYPIDGDFSLLEPVYERGQIYREC